MADVGVDAIAEEAAAGPDRERPQGRTRPMVLIGEDDPDIQDAVSELLATAGYEVVLAGDGQELATLLDGGLRPNVILLDLMMPRVNGYDFLAWRGVRPELRQIPVVVFSASACNEVLVRAQQITALLVKPVAAQDLLSALSLAAGAGGHDGRCRSASPVR
jgi:CheY-like chemotaxis protein